MITVVASSLSSSIALMVIPASLTTKRDFSFTSIRIGLSFTAPLVAPLLIAPRFILSTIGPQYIPAELVLLILSIGILPFSITYNAISSLNNRGEQRKIIYIGLAEVLTFFVIFFSFVPYYGMTGAAFSILMAFLIPCILSMTWLGKKFLRYVGTSTLAIAVGYFAGYLLGIIIDTQQELLQIITSMATTSIVIVMLKNTSPTEIRELVKTAIGEKK